MSAPSPLAGLRVGFGLAVQRLDDGLPARLAGIELPRSADTAAEDSSDALSEAVIEALLSACGLPELEALLDPVELASAADDAFIRLSHITQALRRNRLQAVLNLDVKLVCAYSIAQRDRTQMLANLAAALGILPAQISLMVTPQPLTPALEQGGALAAFAHLLCALRTPGGAQKLSTEAGLFAEPSVSPPAPAEALEEIPAGRPRDFERAVRTKLPPLPAAPPPKPGDTLIVYTDGASRGNPGAAAAGWVVLDAQGRLVGEGGKTLGERTNNQAEYLAVQTAAVWIEQSLGRGYQLVVRSDSELIVKQLRGEYKVKDAGLRELALQTMSQLMYFDSFELHAVPRAENSRADALANRALDDARR